jgi:signal transduction histidine kinase
MPQCAKILFVDDDRAVLDSLRRGLCRHYDVTTALGPEEGLRVVEAKGPFAVVVSDLRMPGMDGVAFLKTVRERNPMAVGIMLTGHGDLTAAMAAVNEGHIFRFLTKPCPIPSLSRALDAGLEQYRLAAAEKELLRVTLENARLKEDVERIMRHDLKSPLTTILSLPQLLRQADNLTDEQREMLECIEDAGYTVLSMVNLSTALFKMERGQYVLHPDAVDLLPIARKILSVHEDTARHHDLVLTLTVDGEPVEPDTRFLVQGEELLCYSMMANLVANAVEASPDGGTVSLALTRDGDRAVMVIGNQGAVPECVRERFFEKYATAGKPKGTGLGTYSARLIARAHGGDITMRTDGARGTEVTVTMPETP